MDKTEKKLYKRSIRHNRVRAKVYGTLERPRLSVFRANRHIYAQIIDDNSGKTLAASSSVGLKLKDKKISVAAQVGKNIAGKAKEKNISSVVFDRGGFAYHGRIKALAESAREAGLIF